MKLNPVIFREYDIRGVYDTDFDLEFAYNLGRAYITYLKSRGHNTFKLTVGHDARLSSPDVAQNIANGLRDGGAEVLMLGLITSPMSYFTTFHMKDLTGAFMITGSHNPPDYNGFKISYGKSTIFGEEIQKLRKIMDAQDYPQKVSGGKISSYDIFPEYVERYKKEFGDLKGVPVVLDCGNGSAGVIARQLYEAVGLKPHILFEKPDGRFPNHHPDPTVEENLVDLKKKVLETKSLIGIGFDGDADRIGLVDHRGQFVYGDEILALFAQDVLKTTPGSKIIGDVKCSDRMYALIKSLGGEPIMWKTGHSLVKEKIKVEKAPFGGELSGHIFFADRNYGYDDAPYAGLRAVEILAKTGKTIPELLNGMGPAFFTPEIRIDTTEEKKHSIVSSLIKKFGEQKVLPVNLIDGVRVSYPDGWALARASNTQPVLVLRFESSSQAGLDRIRRDFESIVEAQL